MFYFLICLKSVLNTAQVFVDVYYLFVQILYYT